MNCTLERREGTIKNWNQLWQQYNAAYFLSHLKKKLVEKKKRSRFFPPIFSPINHHIILNATLFWQQLKDRINPKTVCINTLILWDIKLIYYLGLSYKMQLLQKNNIPYPRHYKPRLVYFPGVNISTLSC